MRTTAKTLRIGIVGPCTSGKSTLIRSLLVPGIELRHIAQEHSYVPTMWQAIGKPDHLVYLDVSYPESIRRKKLNWTVEEYQEQLRRLQHAREHADFYINTDGMTPEQVAERVTEYIRGLLA